jgi:LmbE family N-acetylglucosaminyl deacetylase
MCNGERPGHENVSTDRVSAFKENCESIGVKFYIKNNPDCSLEYRNTMYDVEKMIREVSPEIVYTHTNTDVHIDHKLLAEVTLVACRPKPNTSVKKLYFFETPQFAPSQDTFKPTVYNDITEYMDLKKQALARYSTEIYEFPDARSIEAVNTLAKYRGYAVGFNYAEAFQLVFSRAHINY